MKRNRILRILVLTALLSVTTGQAQTVIYGNPNDLGLNSLHYPNYLLGSKITIDQPVTLIAAGVIFRAIGYHANIGVYSARLVDGLPDQLLATTGVFSVTSSGTVERPFTTSPFLLPGDYWFMAVYDYYASVGLGNVPSNVVAYRSLTFSSTLPSSFGPATTYTGQQFNYFLVARIGTPTDPILCHKGLTIQVPINSLEYQRHLDHGDTLGPCSVGKSETKQPAGLR